MVEVPFFYTDDIESLPGEYSTEEVTIGVWGLFKKLRKIGLLNHQIILVMDRVVLKKTFRKIREERGYTSIGTIHAEFKRASELIRQRWGKQ